MPNDPAPTKFELRRQSDNLVYTFTRMARSDGSIGYKRADGDYWIALRPDWGWVAWDEASQSCMGRPWNILPQHQGGAPPEGDWVSRKLHKSYVYSSGVCQLAATLCGTTN